MNDLNRNYQSLSFDRAFPTMLIRALDEVLPAYRKIFAEHDLTEQQWRVLRVLWDEAELPSNEISERTVISKTSLVGVLERLEARGLVSRKRDASDRRLVRAKLTDQGRAMREAVMPALMVVNDEISGRLTPAEWETLAALMDLATGKTKR